MNKLDLEVGMVLELKCGERVLYLGEDMLPVISADDRDKCYGCDEFTNYGFEYLSEYTDDLRCEFVDIDDDNDIFKVYKFGKYGYELVWDREKDINNKEYNIAMKDSEGYCWSVNISPNNPVKGYKGSDSNTPICVYSDDCLENIYLTTDGAKELIKSLGEIVEYLEDKQ